MTSAFRPLAHQTRREQCGWIDKKQGHGGDTGWGRVDTHSTLYADLLVACILRPHLSAAETGSKPARKKACKNCSCGRAEMEEEEDTKPATAVTIDGNDDSVQLAQPVAYSACGNVSVPFPPSRTPHPCISTRRSRPWQPACLICVYGVQLQLAGLSVCAAQTCSWLALGVCACE